MRVIRNQFFAPVLLALLAAASVPSAVLAYNGYTMQSDQNTVNGLVQEGVLNPMQAQYLDNRTVNRQYGGFFSNAMNGNGFFGPSMAPQAVYSTGQIRKEDRQLDKLERDGIISRGQEKGMEKQLWSEHNALSNGLVPAPGYMPAMVANPGMFTAAPVYAAQMVQPVAQSGMCHHAAWMASHGLLNNAAPYNNAAQYNPGYYTTSASGTLLNRVSNYWH